MGASPAVFLPSPTGAAALSPPGLVDRSQVDQFVRALFGGLGGCGGFVNFRAIEEPEPVGRKANAIDRWLPIENSLPYRVADLVDEFTAAGFASYLIPAIMREGDGGKTGLIASIALAIDIDSGDIDQKLAGIKALLGEPTMVLHSGGVDKASGHAKSHVYYRVLEPVAAERAAKLDALREAVARRFGCDMKVGRNPVQVLRVAGSPHRKPGGAPTMCRIVSADPTLRHDLETLVRAFGPGLLSTPASPSDASYFDFNSAKPANQNLDRVLTEPVLAEGKSDDGLVRYEAAGMAIGHFIAEMRSGRLTEAQAWERVQGWNAAEMRPPWPEERLRGDFDRLLKRDIGEKGPLLPFVPPPQWQPTPGLRLVDWNARRFKGPPPGRRWIVDGLLPAGTPGVFAAVGDAGKSMLALRLALAVGSYPAPKMAADSPAGVNDTPRFFGQPITGRGTAVILTAEDDADEIHRRLTALDPEGLRLSDASRLIVLPLLTAGGPKPIVIQGRNGPEVTPFWQDIRAQLLDFTDLALVVVDPLSHFVHANTNDNAVGTAVMGEMADVAANSGAAVMLVHHFAKAADIGSLSDARNAIRGAGAFVDNGRWAIVLWEASQDEAYTVLKALGEPARARQAGVVYFGGLTKGNAPGAKVLRTLVRDTKTGLLIDRTSELEQLAPRRDDTDGRLYAAMWAKKMAEPGWYFTASPSALWVAWGPLIRNLGLPITKDGKSKGSESVQTVFERLIDAGRVAKTEDRGAPRYEPVAVA